MALGTPTGLSASVINGGRIDLSWTDNSTTELGHKIERSPNGSSGWSQIGTVGPNVTSYSNTGLQAYTIYYYRVRAYDAGADSAYSGTVSGVPTPISIVAPTSLVATAFSASQINLTWVDNSHGEANQTIKRSLSSGGSYDTVGTVGPDVTAFSDTGLSAGVTYYYKVKADDGSYSSVANATTTAFAAPSGLTATAFSATQIDLAWTDNTSTEDNFKVERSADGSTGWTEIATPTANATTYSNTSLTPGTIYYYRVRAYDAPSTNSAYSNTANATTPATLVAPTSLSATAISGSQIDLTWTDTSTGEDGSRIERSLNGTTGWSEVGTVGPNVGAYSDTTGLSPITAYYYRVRAYDGATNGSYSSNANATTLAGLTAPSSLVANPLSSTAIDLSWTDNSVGEDGFKVERSPNGSTGWTQIGTPAANATTYSDTGLTVDTIYYYRVRAYSGATNGSYSSTASATTGASLAAPTTLTATTISGTQINLAWTDNSVGEDGNKIERSADGVTGWTQIDTAGPNSTTYNNTGLTGATTYYYRVRAYDGITNSTYSNIANTTTSAILASPTSLVATGDGGTQMTLTWTNNSAGETGHKIEYSFNGSTNWTLIYTTGTGASSALFTGLLTNQEYYFRARAFSGATHSSYSSTASSSTGFESPTNLVATAVSSTRIDLAWTDNSIGEAGFKIERSLNQTSGFVQIASILSLGSATYADTGLSPSTTYYYRVRAYDEGVHSGYSNVSGTTTSLVAPTSLTATAVSESQIDLAWTDNSTGETGFRIEMGLNGVSGWTVIATTAANATSYSATGLSSLLTYYFRVSAMSGALASTPSNVAADTTSLGVYTPTDVSVNAISTTALRVSWTPVGIGQDGTKIERSADGSTGWSQVGTAAGTINFFDNTGLSTTTTYYYRVRSYYDTENSSYSEVVPGRTGLTAPLGLAVSEASTTQNDLTWTDASTGEDGFKIERSADGVTGWTQIGTNSSNDATYSDTGLAVGTGYFYRVRAYYSTINSAYSAPASADVPALLNTPTALTAVVISANRADLSWVDTNIGEEGTKIERRVNGTSTWFEIGTVGENVVSYSDTGLVANTFFDWRIRAFSGTVHSLYAGPIGAGTGTSLLQPAGLTVYTFSPTSLQMFWTATNAGETGYQIERSTSPASGFSLIASPGPNETIYTDTGLTTDTAYYYRVRSMHGVGGSPYSEVAGATTGVIMAAPLAFKVTLPYTLGAVYALLAWTDISGGEDGYKVERSLTGVGSWTEIAVVDNADDAQDHQVTGYADTTVTGGVVYYYRVRAYAGITNGPYSAIVSTVIPDVDTAPSGGTATPIDFSRVDLSWTANSVGEDGFLIERSYNGTTGWVLIGQTTTGVTTFSDTRTQPNTTYYYRVQSFAAFSTSPYSSAFSATTGRHIAPPGNTRAEAVGATTLVLFWDNFNIGIPNHQNTKIERSLDGVTGWTQIAVVDPIWTGYSNSGLANYTTYYYRVRFYYGTYAGHSPYSVVFSGTTGDFLTLPTNLTAVQAGGAGSTSITLSWTDASTGEDGYRIERTRVLGVDWVEIGTTIANANTYTDTGLSGGGNYFYRVRAYKGNTFSLYNTTSTEMLLATPISLVATPVSSSQINLAWSDTNLGEDGYSVERSADNVTWTVIGTAAENYLAFADAPLSPSTLYYYRVRAFAGPTYSSYSNTASGTTDIAHIDTRRGDRLRTRRIHDLVPEPVAGYVLNPQRSFFSIVVPEETINLVTDPEMRTGASYAAVGGATLERQSLVQRRGIFSYKIYTIPAGGGIRYTLPAPLAINQPYTFSCDLKGSGTYTMYFSTIGGSVVGRTEVVDGRGFWLRVNLSSYITAATVQAVTIVANEPQTNFYVDGFQVENLDHPTTFVSGAMRSAADPEYTWLGAPHRSMSYRGLNTSGGKVVPFSDIGFEVMEFLDLGYAEQVSTFEDYALMHGAYYHGTRSLLRTFSLVGNVSADNFLSFMRKRFSIGDKITGGDAASTPVSIVFQAYDCDEATSEEVQIRAVYKSGMSGAINNLYQERIALTFESGDPTLSAFGNRGAAITLNEPVQLDGLMISISEDGLVAGLPAFETAPGSVRPAKPVVGSDNNLYQSSGRFLNAFNGYAWTTVYRSYPGDAITAMAAGPDGKIYFAVLRNINHFHVYAYDIATGLVDNLHNTQILGSNASNQPVASICCDNDGRMIFAGRFMTIINDVSGELQGLHNVAKYHPDLGSWTRVGNGVGLDVTYDNYVETVAVDGRGFIWAGGHFRNHATDPNTIKDLAIYVSGSWGSGGFWESNEGEENSVIHSIAIHRQTNTVYVAGHFEEVVCRPNGLTYGDLSNIVAIRISDMVAHRPVPYFDIGDQDGAHLLVSVTPLSTGPGFRIPPAPLGYWSSVYGVDVSCNHRVVCVGSFDSVGNGESFYPGVLPSPGIAVWDGNARRWEPSPVDLVAFENGSGFFFYRSWSVTFAGRCDVSSGANGTGLGVLTPAFTPSSSGIGTQPGYSNTFFLNADAESGTTATINVLNNPGRVSVRPEIEITGPGQLYAIRNYTTEKSIFFDNLFVFPGETITVRMNLDDFGVFSSTRENITHLVSSKSSYPDFPLVKGDNKVIVRMTQTTAATAVYFRWPTRYASIDAFVNGGA